MGHLDSSLAGQVRVEEKLLLQFKGLVATVGLPPIPSSWGLNEIKPEVSWTYHDSPFKKKKTLRRLIINARFTFFPPPYEY